MCQHYTHTLLRMGTLSHRQREKLTLFRYPDNKCGTEKLQSLFEYLQQNIRTITLTSKCVLRKKASVDWNFSLGNHSSCAASELLVEVLKRQLHCDSRGLAEGYLLKPAAAALISSTTRKHTVSSVVYKSHLSPVLPYFY